MERTLISINVSTYNRMEMLQRCLESLICQEKGGLFIYEIIVIDNDSTDDTRNVVQKVAGDSAILVKYVKEDRHGLAYARNRGVKESTGDWIAIFDDDQVAEKNWLKELFAVASQAGTDCVGGRLFLVLLAEEMSWLPHECQELLGLGDWGDVSIKYHGKNIPTASNVLRRREVFDVVGEFDTSKIMGGQDMDFSRRAAMLGFESWYAPKAIAYHCVPAYRLAQSYLRLASLRCGRNFSNVNWKHWGRAKTILACIARIGQALLINLPLLVQGYMGGDRGKVLGKKCLLWRCMGYARQTLFLIAPKLFTQKRFFAQLEFRKERETFSKNSEAHPK